MKSDSLAIPRMKTESEERIRTGEDFCGKAVRDFRFAD